MTSDSECMKSAVFHEAGNQSIIGQIAVVNVIHNRVENYRWKNTICDVIKEKNQFSFYSDGKIDHVPSTALNKIVWAIFIGKYIDITWGSFYYHADYVNPSWSKRLIKTVTIGNHIFYTQVK